jgi:hypothetical protein
MKTITDKDFYGRDRDGDPWYVTPEGMAICAPNVAEANATYQNFEENDWKLDTIEGAATTFGITREKP